MTKMSLATISAGLRSAEFDNYVDKVSLESTNSMKAKRIKLLNKILGCTGRRSRFGKWPLYQVISEEHPWIS